MTFLQMVLIALVQGVTEFLPISSSGHLILLPLFTGFADQGPMIDVAVHIGSLLAIIVYFFRDVIGLARGGFATIRVGKAPAERRLFWWILLGTIPAVGFGLLIKSGALNAPLAGWAGIEIQDGDLMSALRLPHLIAFNLIAYGLLLGAADMFGRTGRKYEEMSWRDALIVGAAQALALIPGTSRSGATMTAARMLGYDRVEAARFSFLLGIPAIAGAGVLIVPEIIEQGSAFALEAILTGAMTFLAALATMAFLMRFLRNASMLVFVIYRVAMGVLILALF